MALLQNPWGLHCDSPPRPCHKLHRHLLSPLIPQIPRVLPDHMVHTAGLRVPYSGMPLSLFPLGAPSKLAAFCHSLYGMEQYSQVWNMLPPKPKRPKEGLQGIALLSYWGSGRCSNLFLLWRECARHILDHQPLKISLICQAPESSVFSPTLCNVCISLKLPTYSSFLLIVPNKLVSSIQWISATVSARHVGKTCRSCQTRL